MTRVFSTPNTRNDLHAFKKHMPSSAVVLGPCRIRCILHIRIWTQSQFQLDVI
jgi:hypothetical protein